MKDLMGNPALLEKFLYQARIAFAWNWSYSFSMRQDRFALLAKGAQLVWLFMFVYGLARWRRLPLDAVVMLASPIVFLAVHLFYQGDIYWPRHIVIGHIAMLTSAMYAWRTLENTNSGNNT